MRYYTCENCKKIFEFYAKSSYKRFCSACMRKRRSIQTMLYRKKKFPEIELGVGSGNSSKNKNQPIGIGTYSKLAKVKGAKCVLCKSKNFLLVHHIDYNKRNNALNNLQILCKSCHQKYHVKRDPITGRFIK